MKGERVFSTIMAFGTKLCTAEPFVRLFASVSEISMVQRIIIITNLYFFCRVSSNEISVISDIWKFRASGENTTS